MRLLLTICTLLAVSLTAVPAADAFERVVSRNGRVGDVQIDRATMSQVRKMEGRRGRTSAVQGENGRTGTELRYDCGRSRSSSYIFDSAGRLSNFLTTCRSWRTADGTSVGDAQDDAESAEGKAATTAGCGNGETITRRGRATLYVTFFTVGGSVRALAVEGRRSVLGC